MMSEKQLKPGWQTVKFGDVVQLNTERRADPLAAGIERYVGLEHIEPEDLKIRHWGQVADGTTFTNYFKPGQVLFGKRRAYQRKVAVADFEGVCSGDIYVFEPKDERLLPELLPYICQTEGFYQHAVGTSAGSLSPRTNWGQLAGYEFALPSLEEQQRIANLLMAIENYLEQLNKLLDTTARLRKSYLIEKFTQLLNEGAQMVKMSQAGEVLIGRQRSPEYEKGIAPHQYLRVANVFDGYIDITDVKTMDFCDPEFEVYHLKYGDVLLVEGHSSADVVGRSAIYKDEVPNACFQNTLLRFRPYNLSPEYAHQYFQYCLYTRKFSRVAKQTTIAHLGFTRFSSMLFPLVAIETEKNITNAIANIDTNLVNLTKRIYETKSIKQHLFTTLLAVNTKQ